MPYQPPEDVEVVGLARQKCLTIEWTGGKLHAGGVIALLDQGTPARRAFGVFRRFESARITGRLIDPRHALDNSEINAPPMVLTPIRWWA